MTSPRLTSAAESNRTEADVRALRAANHNKPDALGNKTYYTIFVRWPREIRPFTVESPMLETEQEVIDAILDIAGPCEIVAVFRNDYDIPRQDVSEDVARRWAEAIVGSDGYDEETRFPPFVEMHLTESDLNDILREAKSWK